MSAKKWYFGGMRLDVGRVDSVMARSKKSTEVGALAGGDDDGDGAVRGG